MPKLSNAERDAFLNEPGVILHLATLRADGRPAVAPMWFIYEESAIWFTPRAHSQWLDDMRADSRVALAIDEQPLPYRKVVVEGRAELAFDVGNDDVWRERYRRIARRYVPNEAADAYLQNTIDQPRALWYVKLADAHVRSWRMPIADEQGTGIWHRRYYVSGSKLAQQADEKSG